MKTPGVHKIPCSYDIFYLRKIRVWTSLMEPIHASKQVLMDITIPFQDNGNSEKISIAQTHVTQSTQFNVIKLK